MKKFVFFNSTLNIGGPARVISLWAKYLSSIGHEVEVVSNCDHSTKFEFGEKIKISTLGIDLGVQRSRINTLMKIKKFLMPRKNEVLIFNKSLYTIYVLALKYLKLIDKSNILVYYVHGGSSDFLNLYSNFRSYLMLKTYDFFIILHDDYLDFEIKNKKLKKFLHKYQWPRIKEKSFFIPNPVSFLHNSIINYNSKNVLAVGRLDYIKGFDLLINAWSLIEGDYKDWKLKIVGSGAELQNLLDLIAQLNLKNIEILPETQNIIDHYRDASIFVLSSREEGQPMVVLEAMECGLPIVAFKNVGSQFLVKDNGYLCDINDLKSFSNNMVKLIKDANLRMELGGISKENAKQFHPEFVQLMWDIFIKKCESKN